MAKARGARLAAVPNQQQRSLSQTERQDLQAAWGRIPGLPCRDCGTGHEGVCPRVKRRETVRLANGAITERVWYWPEGDWSLPPDAIRHSDVWPDGAPIQTTVIEAEATETKKEKKG